MPATSVPKSLVFASPDGLDIELDYDLPETASAEQPVPILVWWHGGGLLQGSRKTIWPHLVRAPALHNLCVVSPDYRLAPQTRLPDILEDIASLLSFIRSDKFVAATGGRVDPSKVIVSGGSAGGWLALLAGTGTGFEAAGLAPPEKPLAIAAIYPITDLMDPFWVTKQHPVSYAKRVFTESEMAEYLDPNSAKTTFVPPGSTRSEFYTYMVQEGILANLLLDGTGLDPSAFSIARSILSGAVDPVPPIYIVHGSIDDKVPPSQSLDVVAALEKKGVEHDFEWLEGKDHLYDKDEGEEMERMYAFIRRVLERAQ
ncbi:hypothetical protein JCM10207_001523 [Rhodosporidiobolus poonsookiae]